MASPEHSAPLRTQLHSERRFLRRSWIGLLLSALLGLLTTVLVAWVCVFLPVRGPIYSPLELGRATVWTYESHGRGFDSVGFSFVPEVGVSVSLTGEDLAALDANGIVAGPNGRGPFQEWVRLPPVGVPTRYTWTAVAGWPFRALSNHFEGVRFAAPPTPALRIPVRGGYLPLAPMWCGLFADFAFYTLAWAALIVGLPRMRQARRRWRGHCVKCTYGRRGIPNDSPCPECGAVGPAVAGSN